MIVLFFLGLLYFLPTIVASHRGLRTGGVLILNLFFGWTGLGWLALLLWALVAPPPCYFVPMPYHYPYWYR